MRSARPRSCGGVVVTSGPVPSTRVGDETKWQAGDVVHYEPGPAFPGQTDVRWCREGTAIAGANRDGSVTLVDTYWGIRDGQSHALTDDELATAELRFNLADYDELNRYDRGARQEWEKYAPADRERVTSQHGLQSRWFVRKGAAEDHATIVQNARDRLAEAESALESARYSVESRLRDLDELLATEASHV